MASKKLTQHFVDTVKAESSDTFYWHTERIQQNARLGLKVTRAGKKVFVLQYRPLGGRRDVTRRLTLSASDLKGAEREARSLFRKHHDPARSRQEERRAETVAEAMPLFLEELAGKRKGRTVYETTRILGGSHEGVSHAGYVLAAIGSARVRDVDAIVIASLHRRVWNGDDRKRPIMANRVLAALSAFFTWAEGRGFRPRGSNPTRGIDRYPERRRERYLNGDELGRLSDALRRAELEGIAPATRLRKATREPLNLKHRPKSADSPRRADPVAVAAIRFLMLTGFREQEGLSLRWDAIDFARGDVTLEDSKTGKSIRTLGAPALALLSALPREGEYVFPGAMPGQPRKEVKRLWYAVREEAKIEGLRLHDLRHTVASFAASGGASLPMIAELLGHRDLKSTQRYAHLFDESRRRLADRTSGDIEAAMGSSEVRVLHLRGSR